MSQFVRVLAAAGLIGVPLMGEAADVDRPALAVWDSRGVLIGDYVGNSSVVVQPAGVPTFVPFNRDRLGDADVVFYYASGDCSGTPFLRNDTQPPFGYVYNGVLFYPGPAQTLVAQSYSISDVNGSGCVGGGGSETFPAAQVEQVAAPKVLPPLCVSSTKVACK